MSLHKNIAVLITVSFAISIAATELYLPSLPQIATFFNTSKEMVQLSVSAHFFGTLLLTLIVGVLSDYYGRHPIMLAGMLIYILGVLSCICAPSIWFFIFGRFIQGIGSVVIPVVGIAAIYDSYSSDESAKIISWMGTALSLVSLAAPTIGGYIASAYGWRANFILIFIIIMPTMMLVHKFYSGTPRHAFTEKIDIALTFKQSFILVKHKKFLLYTLIFALLACGKWIFLTMLPFYLENTLALSLYETGLVLSIIGTAYFIGTSIAPRLINWIGLDQTIKVGVSLCLISGIFLINVTFYHGARALIYLCLALWLYTSGLALLWGPTTSRALEHFPEALGKASGIRVFTMTTFKSLGGLIGGLISAQTLLPLAGFLTLLSLCAFLIIYNLLKAEKS